MADKHKGPDAGYEMPGDDEDKDAPVRFDLEFYPTFSGSAVHGVVTRNGVAVGTIRFKTPEELTWMQYRMRGTFDPTQFNVGIEDPAPPQEESR
jgi:hypothetical protein